MLSVAPMHATPLHSSRYRMHSVTTQPSSDLAVDQDASAVVVTTSPPAGSSGEAAEADTATKEALRWDYYALARRFATLEQPRGFNGATVRGHIEREGWLRIKGGESAFQGKSEARSKLAQQASEAWRQARARFSHAERACFALMTKGSGDRVDSRSLQFFDHQPSWPVSRTDSQLLHRSRALHSIALPPPPWLVVTGDTSADTPASSGGDDDGGGDGGGGSGSGDGGLLSVHGGDDADGSAIAATPSRCFRLLVRSPYAAPDAPEARVYDFEADSLTDAAEWVSVLRDQSRASVARAAPITEAVQAWRQDARVWLISVLQLCNPSTRGDVDALIEEWFGEEDQLLARVARKYNIAEPAAAAPRVGWQSGSADVSDAAAALPRTISDADRQLQAAIAHSMADDTALSSQPEDAHTSDPLDTAAPASPRTRDRAVSIPFSEWNDFDETKYECLLLANALGTRYRMVSLEPDPLRPTETHEEEVGTLDYQRSRDDPCRFSICIPQLAGGDRPAVLGAGDLRRYHRSFSEDGADDGEGEREEPDAVVTRGQAEVVQLLETVPPAWNDSIGAWCHEFGGRVLLPSGTACKVAMVDPVARTGGRGQSRTAPVLQFGRVSDHEFTLDFRRPLNLVQAVHSFV
eukprot:COSAG01_NODE_6419_length_3677_cov_4.291783_1_plen_635_part_10